MKHGLELASVLLFLLVSFLMIRPRGSSPSKPTEPLVPAGPEGIGDLSRLPVRTTVKPAPDANPWPVAAGVPLSSDQRDELSKLDSLVGSGTLKEEEYQQARARVLGSSDSTCKLTVISAGENKIFAIKALRQARRDLDLAHAKTFIENLPQTLFIGLTQADAERVTRYLQQAGVSVRLEE